MTLYKELIGRHNGAMPRIARVAPGGLIQHVINRANGRLRPFKKDEDFETFYGVLLQAQERYPLPLLAWCVMGNHWHFVVRPRKDGDLSRFFGYLSLTHASRWQAAHNSTGAGHVYSGRFKNFLIQEDEHLLQVLRFVERNPLRTGQVKKAQDWKWSSLHARLKGPAQMQNLLAEWPIARPRDWVREVNRPQTPEDESAIETSLNRGRPFGDAAWVQRMAKRYNLLTTIRPRGRQPGWRKNPKTKTPA